jgi:hypothetical protein
MSGIEVGEPGAGTPGTSATEPGVTALAPFNRWVIGVGGLLFAVLMALSDRYGFHHDELYFLDCARHLQASYVDQPVFTPLMPWVSLKLFRPVAGGAAPVAGPGRVGHGHPGWTDRP